MTTPVRPDLTACYDLMSMLQAEFRTADKLRQHLESGENRETLAALCEVLLDSAVETARTAADLRDRVCGEPGVDRPNSTGVYRD
jgi:hypothetical protein